MSANASKGKIISLADARKERLLGNHPAPFDPAAVQQRINRVRITPSPEERELAIAMVLSDAEHMLRALGLMGGEILQYRQQIRILAQQNADVGTINSVLIHLAGGEVRMDSDAFAAFEVTGGYSITEEGSEVVIRHVDEVPATGVGSVSASQQTEGD
jgi:hypothetical protein